MIDIQKEYQRNRERMNAKDSWSCAKHAVRREFEQKLRGFEFLERSQINNGYAVKVFLDDEEYEVHIEYDTDYYTFDTTEVEQLNKRPYNGQYAREQVMEVGNRDTQYLVLDEGPKERAKWYSKQGDSRQVAYEKGSESCMKSLKYYKGIYENGADSYYVRIDKDGESLDACGGIEEDYIEEFVWEQIS